jgi:hypothetical protein
LTAARVARRDSISVAISTRRATTNGATLCGFVVVRDLQLVAPNRGTMITTTLLATVRDGIGKVRRAELRQREAQRRAAE